MAALKISALRRSRVSAALVAATVVALATSVLAQGPGGTARVVVAPVVERSIATEQSFVGTIVPRRTSVVGSAVAGRVIELHVDEGDFVTKGQPLAQLRTGTLEIELAAAKAELALRQEELRELVNGSRPEEIQQAAARMASAKALMDYSASRHQRNEVLYRRGQAITEDEMDKSRSTMIDTQQAYLETKAAYELAVAGPRQERIARAQAYVTVQEEQVREIEDRLEKHTLRAPFDGFVVAKMTEIGQWINEAEAVAEIAELLPAEVETHVPESYIARLQLGMPAAVRLDAIPGKTFEGKVVHLVPRADARSRTFPVKVQVPNELQAGIPLLKAGMLARVGLPVASVESATLVPKDALVLGGPTPMVYVVENGKVRPVPVEVGISDGGWIQVRGDLKPTQQVVTKGNERLFPNQAVEIIRVTAAD